MLMVLPLLSYSEIDFSSEYGLRELFWFGRSSCENVNGTFYCQENDWVTTEGWNELLRQYVDSSYGSEGQALTKTVLWIYVPDFNSSGRMASI